jgi:hypothetical protein
LNLSVQAGAVAGILLLASGCGKSQPGVAVPPAPDRSPFATVGRAEKLTLLEGLPHPGNDHKAFEKEQKTKETVDLHGYAFYREPLALTAEDTGKLKALVGDPALFAPFIGEKKCGGFHPDYAVEWTVDGQVYRCLCCFGCSEVKLFGPLGETRLEMADAGFALSRVLKPYQKNRPLANVKNVPG